MQLTIVAPCGMLCHTTVEKVSFPGALGDFTVLPHHAPLIAQLTSGKIRYTAGATEHEQEIRRGFVKVLNDMVEANVETSGAPSKKETDNAMDV